MSLHVDIVEQSVTINRTFWTEQINKNTINSPGGADESQQENWYYYFFSSQSVPGTGDKDKDDDKGMTIEEKKEAERQRWSERKKTRPGVDKVKPKIWFKYSL